MEEKAPANLKDLNIVIIGAGIIGMSTAVRLLQNGVKNVTVVTKDPPLHTNSDVAAALWRPFDAKPIERSLKWSNESYLEYFDLLYNSAIGKEKETGISFIVDLEYFGEEIKEKPEWMKGADNLLDQLIERLKKDSHPGAQKMLKNLEEQKSKIPGIIQNSNNHPTRPNKFASVVPLIDTTIYRPWLLNKFENLGGKIVEGEVNKITHPLEIEMEANVKKSLAYDVVINCAGEKTRQLEPDSQIYPVRGQIVITEIPKNLDYCIGVEPNPPLDNGEVIITYAIVRPRPDGGDCILGGTYQMFDTNISPDSNDTQDIIKRTSLLMPGIAPPDIKIKAVKVGLRSGRTEVLCESKEEKGKLKITMGGHGGGGVSASIGVANEGVHLCSEYVDNLNIKPLNKL